MCKPFRAYQSAAETIFLDLHLLSLDLITKVSTTPSKGNIVIINIHVSQHPHIVPVIPVNLGLVREAISTDHGLTEELPGFSRLGSSVGSLVSVILRLEIRLWLAMQIGADSAQIIAICTGPSIILHNRKPLTDLHILILVLITRRRIRLEGRSSSCRSNILSGLCICVRSVHSSCSRIHPGGQPYRLATFYCA
jgi:hypothetical protein